MLSSPLESDWHGRTKDDFLAGRVGIPVLSMVQAPCGTKVKLLSSSGSSFAHPVPFHSFLLSSLSQEHFTELSSQAPLLGASDRTEEEVMDAI